MSNSLNPDQAQRFIGPDLDPNCLHMLSADDTSSQRVRPTRRAGHFVILRRNSSETLINKRINDLGITHLVPFYDKKSALSSKYRTSIKMCVRL